MSNTRARALEASADFRVLRRLPYLEEVWLTPIPAGGPAITLAAIDTETCGLSETDRMIELAVVKLSLTADGQLCRVEPVISQFEDPGCPLSAEITAITGIDDAMVADHQFDEAALAASLGPVDAIVAFNATFDAAFWRRRFPWLDKPWLCALRDMDWMAEGHVERSQAALLAAQGHFYPAHQATVDAWALAMLMAMPARDGRTIAAHIVDAGRRTGSRIAAMQAPYSVRGELKERGYRWCPRRRVWRTDVAADQSGSEVAWLQKLDLRIRPTIEKIDWHNRHID